MSRPTADQIVSDHAHVAKGLLEIIASAVREEIAARAAAKLEGWAQDETVDEALARAIWIRLSDAKLLVDRACAHQFSLGMCKHCDSANIGQFDRATLIARDAHKG